MTLFNLVQQINRYEYGLYRDLKTKWNKTRFQPQNKKELRNAVAQ
jgi:hypothetical protein